MEARRCHLRARGDQEYSWSRSRLRRGNCFLAVAVTAAAPEFSTGFRPGLRRKRGMSMDAILQHTKMDRHTQSCLQLFDVTPLGAALLAHFVVGALVAQPRTRPTTRSLSVASELSSSADDTGDALHARDIRGAVGVGMARGGGCCRAVCVCRGMSWVGRVLRRWMV